MYGACSFTRAAVEESEDGSGFGRFASLFVLLSVGFLL